MTVVTNIVVCMKVVTSALVPCACPDKIEGCCVLHMKHQNVSTEYIELKMSEFDDPHRGVAYIIDDLCLNARAIQRNAEGFGCTNNIPYPIRAYDTDIGGARRFSHNIIGVFWPKEVERACDYLHKVCGK